VLKKNHIIHVFKVFLTLSVLSFNQEVLAQFSLSGNEAYKNDYQEKLLINTDRDLYITGEVVWLKVYKLNGLSGIPSDISKIVYLELLDNSDNPVSQIKIWVNGSSGSSGFRLSDTLSSGNYLLRAYSKWMLNYSAEQFFYKTLTIINPFKNFSQLINTSGKPDQVSDFSPVSATREAERRIAKENRININIVLQKKDFRSREKVRLDITVTDPKGNPVETDMSVSVTKPALLNMQRMTLYKGFEKPGNTSLQSVILSSGSPGNPLKNDSDTTIIRRLPDYLPEIEGPLLSGTIKNKKTGEAFKNIDISLSIVGKTARCQFVRTNDKGEFNFVLREEYGLSEIVVQPLSPDMPQSYVELNLPFCSSFSDNKPELIYLDSTKKESLNKAIISMQVKNLYEPLRQNKLVNQTNNANPDFFGKPDRRIKMSEYIELKNVREIVKEIIPEMTVIKKNSKFSFKIINSYPFQPFENQALILVDGVPVYDIENLLNVSSKDIERVDIINRRYFFSDYIFDGIVSLVTKKGDMSAFESEYSSYRQVFEGYKSEHIFNSIDYAIDSLKKSHIPDFRNTLYWKPDLNSGKDGKASAEFYTSDETGSYTIIVEGISANGNKGFYTIPLLVR
jgi:hypothetical protein